MSYPTTTLESRTARQSGTDYAASIERTRRHDPSGKLIVAVLLVFLITWVLTK